MTALLDIVGFFAKCGVSIKDIRLLSCYKEHNAITSLQHMSCYLNTVFQKEVFVFQNKLFVFESWKF